MTLEESFLKQAIQNATIAMDTYHCPTKRLIQNLQTRGVDFLRDQVQRHHVSDGFDALCSWGHLELTPEVLMTEGRYAALFTDDQANWCLATLLDAGYYGF